MNGDLVFRFPRGPAIAAQLAVESRLLPELAPSLPLAVPRFEYLPRDDTTGLPIFAGYRAIPGEPLTPALLAQVGDGPSSRGLGSLSPHAAVSHPASPSATPSGSPSPRGERGLGGEDPAGPGGEDLPAALGAFLAALHAFPVNRARELGAEEAREPDHTRALFESVREYVYPRLTPAVRRWTDHLFGDYLANPRLWEFAPALVHGDLSSDHILYDRAAGHLGGIIDFGDAGIYDPISDFVGLIDYGDAFLQAALAAHPATLDPLPL
ncbi:MAG TPA: phosphotransferase, partial [Ktedonobacterales bacterium]